MEPVSGNGDNLGHHVDQMVKKVDEIERAVNKVSQFYSRLSKKHANNSNESKEFIKKHKQDAAKREADRAKRRQELMRQFSIILRQIKQHKYAYPFLQPVDVEGLGLHDYYEIIEKPMDFSTIENKMEVKDGNGYKNVREIFADVKLVFKNAMTYNDEKSEVHGMAKILLDKFGQKWLQLLPKVLEEEARQKEEEAKEKTYMNLAHEAANAKLARDMSQKLSEVDVDLDILRETVMQKCRKMSTEEKKRLVSGLTRLSAQELDMAVEIVAHKNPNFQVKTEVTDIDIDAQSELTLWRLKVFLKKTLEAKASATKVDNDNSKRKREICDAKAKSAKKRSKILPS